MKKRIFGIALSTVLCFGAVFGALTLRGAAYVRVNRENWRALMWLVPAARYEQVVRTMGWSDDPDAKDVWIACYDEQGRLLRSVYFTHGEWLPGRTDLVYHSDSAHSEYSRGRGQDSALHFTTDELGRIVRVEYDDGVSAVMQYEGEWENPVLTERYDAQGALIEKYTQTLDERGDAVHHETWAADGSLFSRTEYTHDERGNILTMHAEYSDGETYDHRWDWEYGEDGSATRYSDDGQTDHYRYDEQGRKVYQRTESETAEYGWVMETAYRDITR